MSGSKLSDAQLVLLSLAAQHPQGAIKTELKGPLPRKWWASSYANSWSRRWPRAARFRSGDAMSGWARWRTPRQATPRFKAAAANRIEDKASPSQEQTAPLMRPSVAVPSDRTLTGRSGAASPHAAFKVDLPCCRYPQWTLRSSIIYRGQNCASRSDHHACSPAQTAGGLLCALLC
jgi:hypothetical protein